MKSFGSFLTEAESLAAQQAKQLGLVSAGYGNWRDPRTGQVTHRTVKGQLQPVAPGQEGGQQQQAAQDDPSAAAAPPEGEEMPSQPVQVSDDDPRIEMLAKAMAGGKWSVGDAAFKKSRMELAKTQLQAVEDQKFAEMQATMPSEEPVEPEMDPAEAELQKMEMDNKKLELQNQKKELQLQKKELDAAARGDDPLGKMQNKKKREQAANKQARAELAAERRAEREAAGGGQPPKKSPAPKKAEEDDGTGGDLDKLLGKIQNKKSKAKPKATSKKNAAADAIEDRPDGPRTMDDVQKSFGDFRKLAEPKRKGAKGDAERAEFAKEMSPERDGAEETKKQRAIAAKTPVDAKKNIDDLMKAYGISDALQKQREERAKKLGKKQKVATNATEQQEGNSLITFFSAIEQGKNLHAGGDLELFDMLNQNFPEMARAPEKIQKEWYKNFLEQGKSLRKYLGLGDDEVDKSYDYERVSGSGVNYIPSEKQHSIIKDTWNKFTPAQKKLYGNKDDSWNPADVSMVKSDQKEAITKQIDKILKDTRDMDPSVGPALVNSYMKSLAANKILIPISLKQGDVDKGAKVGVNEYNIGKSGALVDEDGNPKPVTGSFSKGKAPKTEMGITKNSDGELGFDSNSMLFSPSFNIGGKEVNYAIENKPSSLNSDSFEIRELVGGKAANARGGAVPAPVTAKMVKDTLGVDINDRMGLGQKQGSTAPFSDSDAKYYADLYKGLEGDENFNFGKQGLAWGKKKVEPEEYFKKLFDMANTGKDSETGVKYEAKFKKALRSKLRHLKIMAAMKKKSDEGDLGTFLASLYYSAGKVNMDDDSVKGPFVKIQ